MNNSRSNLFIEWICPVCGQMVLSKEKPEPIKWTDGHVCRFIEKKEE